MSHRRLSTDLGDKSLAFQLRLLALATAIPLLLLAFLIFQQMVAQERESVRQLLLTNARTLAGLVDNEIKTQAAIASTLSKSSTLQSGNLQQFWHEAQEALKFVPNSWLNVASPDGTILLATLVPPGTLPPKHASPELIKRAFETGRYQVSNVLTAASSQRLTVLVIVPVFRDGKPLYCLSIAVEPATFLQLISNRFSDNYVVAVLDGNLKFVRAFLNMKRG